MIICLRVDADRIPEYGVLKAVVCVRLENLADYPNISVIGLPVKSDNSKAYSAFEFKSGEFFLIQKFCPIILCAINKEYLNAKGIGNIDWDKDKNVIKSNLIVDARNCKEKTPIKMVQLNYKISGFTDSKVAFFLSSKTNIYSDYNLDFEPKYGTSGE